jgi:hypothetical protein
VDRPQLSQSFPNPTGDIARIQFVMPEAGTARLTLEDVAGRRIATLLDQPMTAGHHEVIWNGRKTDGQRAAAGIYFYRLLVNGEASGARRLIVR